MLLTGEIVAWLYPNILLKKAKKTNKTKTIYCWLYNINKPSLNHTSIHFSVEISNTVTVLYPLNVKQMSPFNNKKYI